MVLDLQVKTYFLITGASRGIGQTIATNIANRLGMGSVVVLLARNSDGLAKTKASIKASGKPVHVQTYAIDLSTATANDFQSMLKESMLVCHEQVTNFKRAIIIHNAGTVGDVSKLAIETADTRIWTQYYHTNVFSTIALNCEFFRVFGRVPKVVVNISSKCAVEPFGSMSYYCSAKAARESYFKVLALEDDQDTMVLNYAPGAIDTDMTVLVQQESVNMDLAAEFKRQRETKTMLTSAQTADKLVMVLEAQNYVSGAHVDYWD